MQLHSDWIALLREFNAVGVEYMVVGAAAIGYHAVPRATRDFDVWVRPSPGNARLVYRALAVFGAPMDQVSVADFERDDTVWQLGVEPLRIDVLTGIEGVEFDDAWPRRDHATIDGLDVPVISRRDLIVNKRAAGRHQDLADLELLGESLASD
ncbi:MAG TPA: nucleotidyltransferase [Candidatus Cybelea sp.]|nr:nucleotidyltransferase [Candidatus Cybelea sp.]